MAVELVHLHTSTSRTRLASAWWIILAETLHKYGEVVPAVDEDGEWAKEAVVVTSVADKALAVKEDKEDGVAGTREEEDSAEDGEIGIKSVIFFSSP